MSTEKGVKLDSGKPEIDLIVLDMSRALTEVSKVATFGKNKYTEKGWIEVPDGEKRYTNALLRHLLAEGRGEIIDPEMRIPHAAAVAWNALARLDLMLRDGG